MLVQQYTMAPHFNIPEHSRFVAAQAQNMTMNSMLAQRSEAQGLKIGLHSIQHAFAINEFASVESHTKVGTVHRLGIHHTVSFFGGLSVLVATNTKHNKCYLGGAGFHI
jgi:hypothetical protein